MKALKIIQFSDLHLFRTSSSRLLNINTDQSFRRVIESAKKEAGSVDFVLVTGDISQDGSLSSYQRAARYLNRFKVPVYCLPGNHDNKAVMKRGLRGPFVSTPRQIIHGLWNVILLDSTIPHSHSGNLRVAELEFVKTGIKRYPNHHVLICFHHSPFKLESWWLDTMKIKNAKIFLKLVDKKQQVAGVIFGHVHQTVSKKRKGVVYAAAPSTCIQFKPKSAPFKLDTTAPGYQVIQLNPDGSVSARVRRLKNSPFKPDFSSRGY